MKQIIYSLPFFILLALFQIAKAQPTLLWAKSMGGPNGEWGMTVTRDGAGNVYTIGFFVGTVDFDPGPRIFGLSGGPQDLFVQKLSPAGNLISAINIGQGVSNYLMGRGIAIDAFGNVLVNGYFFGSSASDFDPGLEVFKIKPSTRSDTFVLKLRYYGST